MGSKTSMASSVLPFQLPSANKINNEFKWKLKFSRRQRSFVALIWLMKSAKCCLNTAIFTVPQKWIIEWRVKFFNSKRHNRCTYQHDFVFEFVSASNLKWKRGKSIILNYPFGLARFFRFSVCMWPNWSTRTHSHENDFWFLEISGWVLAGELKWMGALEPYTSRHKRSPHH